MTTTSLKRNFAWAISGNVVLAAAQWGILIALAKLGSAELVGRYALALTITAPVILFCNFQLRVVQATDTGNRFDFQDFLRLRLATSVAQIILIGAVAASLGYTRETQAVIIAVGLIKTVEGVSDVYFGLLQKHEWMRRIALSQMGRGISSLVAMTVLLAWTNSLLLAVVGTGIAWLAILVFFDTRSVMRLHPVPPRDEAGGKNAGRKWWGKASALFRAALPLGFVSMLVSSFWTIPRYLLEAAHGESVLGYFAVMAYFIVPVTTVVDALGQSSISRLARHYTTNRPAFRQLLLKLTVVASLSGVAGVGTIGMFGERLLQFFYGPSYSIHSDVFPLLMCVGGLICICSVFGVALTAAGFFRLQLWIAAAVLAVNTICGLWLIPSGGIKGTVWTVVAGAASWCSLALGAIAWVLIRNPLPTPANQNASL